ncbi:MAG: hypothetical protein AB8I08_07335 [Sandaracinaceae bacterium]
MALSTARTVGSVVALLSVVTAASGCEEPPLEPNVAARAEPSRGPEDDVSSETSLWRDDVEGIEAASARFRSLGACVAALQSGTPTAVVEGLDDLGYDAFFEQTCRSLQAVHEGDRAACDDLTVSTARAGCLRRLAIVHGRPEACPRVRAREGREPTCIAWASRDPSLCAAAALADRPTCRAAFEGEGACDPLPPFSRARCAAQVQRFGDVVEGSDPSRAPRGPRAFTLTARVRGEEPVHIDGSFVDRGVTLRAHGCQWHVEMIDPLQPAVGVGSDRAHAGLALSVPAEARPGTSVPLDASAAVLTLVLPGRGGLTSMAGASGEVELSRFEAERGGAVRGEIRGRLRSGAEFVEVEGEFTTFVADLDPLDARCEG